MKIRKDVDLNVLKELGYSDFGTCFRLGNVHFDKDREPTFDWSITVYVDKRVEITSSQTTDFNTLIELKHNLDLLQEYCEKENDYGKKKENRVQVNQSQE